MDPPSCPAPATPDDRSRRLARAERVLACWQQALGHDLPNQLVAVQGLLQVLALEQRERLSADGRDYLDRLVALTRKVQDTLTALKAIGRAAADTGAAEDVNLEELAREVAAEVRQLFPGRAVTYHLRLQTSVVKVFRRPLHRAVVELIRTLLVEDEGADTHLSLDSRATPAGVELAVGPWSNGAELLPAAPVPPPAAGAGTNPLGLALVRELVDTWGGTLTVAAAPGGGKGYTVLVRRLS